MEPPEPEGAVCASGLSASGARLHNEYNLTTAAHAWGEVLVLISTVTVPVPPSVPSAREIDTKEGLW